MDNENKNFSRPVLNDKSTSLDVVQQINNTLVIITSVS